MAYIPDSTFRHFLTLNYPTCMTGDSLNTSCPQVLSETGISVTGLSTLNDLTGVQYFTGIGFLHCYDNQLTYIPPLTACLSLNTFICSGNLLTNLPPLPGSVTYMDCSDNLLTSIASLPPGLFGLCCANNQLTSLPPVPGTLFILACNDNFLTSLPDLSGLTSIDSLDCENNFLTELPPLPSNGTYIKCRNNDIHCLPIIPTGVNELMAYAGNSITCLPPDFIVSIHDFPLMSVCDASNLNGCTYGTISGMSYSDVNSNCVFDAGDFPLMNRLIKVGIDGYIYTDISGNYEFSESAAGSYAVDQIISNPSIWDISCSGIPYSVTLTTGADSATNIDFPNEQLISCAILTVDISSPRQRRCFSNNTYSVAYQNLGSATASSSYIEIEFPSEIVPLSSTLPWSSVSGSTYTFNLGNISPGGFGSFVIYDSVSCSSLLNQTVCAKAEIFPHTPCAVSGMWDNSSVAVEGECQSDSIRFTISNIGTGTMTNYSSYSIYEDNVLLVYGEPFQLNSGEDTVIVIAGTGTTYRLDAIQSPFHPGSNNPRSIVELCGSPGTSLGYVISVAQNDEDEFIEIDCKQIIASFDPNDKSVQPSGVGASHFIVEEDELEYHINFQNTGNDTAFTVVVIDTLDIAHLDLNTIQPGVSSHPYSFSIGGGVAKWTFNNIYLTDTVTSEPESHGWFKYKVKQNSSNEPGDVINNKAAIYFDFNDPIITNNTFVTIQTFEIIFSVNDLTDPNASLEVYPNPTAGETNVNINVAEAGKYTLSIMNSLGQLISSEEIMINKNGMSKQFSVQGSGVYFIRLTGHGHPITRKIIKY